MGKKVAIVTFRFLNFGTVLQSLGLQEALRKVGLNDVEILDFPNEGGLSGRAAFFDTLKEQTSEYGIVVGSIRSVLEVIFALRARHDMRKDHTAEIMQRESYYRKFESRYLHLSKPMKCADLRDNGFVESLPYDGYIAGSDQIWNEKYTNCLDIYFLKYMPNNKLRMSYAGSFGRTFLEDSKRPLFADLIRNINPILVREQGAKRIADDISDRESFVVPDPTLLHDKSFWLQHAEKPEQNVGEDYILVYSLNHDLSIYKEALRVGKKHGKRIVAIKRHFNPPYYKSICWLYAIGPQHFIWLIQHSFLVITNSYHAVAFSLILNKPCFPFLDKAEEVNERIISLLNSVEHSQIVTYWGDGHLNADVSVFDYKKINERIRLSREETYQKHLSRIITNLNLENLGKKEQSIDPELCAAHEL